MADESIARFDICDSENRRGRTYHRTVSVYEYGIRDPLVGMSLMYDYELVLPILEPAGPLLRSGESKMDSVHEHDADR